MDWLLVLRYPILIESENSPLLFCCEQDYFCQPGSRITFFAILYENRRFCVDR